MKGSELLSGLAALVDDECRKGPEGLGERVAKRVAFEWGGQKLYIPFDRARRAQMIYAYFDGSNYGRLALKYGRAEDTIRRIINQERARRRMRQYSLLDI